MRACASLSAGALALAVAAGGVLASGCSLLSDAATSATAPLTALPATDVVVETNLETSLTVVRTGAATGAGLAGMPGFVAGASDNPSATSFARPSPAVTVLAAYNNVTRDCLGVAVLSAAPPAPVLGRTAAGSYYFVARSTPPGGCAASTFAADAAVPGGWPSGDPSSAGFPAS